MLSYRLYYNTLTVQEQSEAKRAIYELASFVSLAILLTMLRAGLDDDDELKTEILGRSVVDVFETNIIGKYKEDLQKEIKDCKKDKEKLKSKTKKSVKYMAIAKSANLK